MRAIYQIAATVLIAIAASAAGPAQAPDAVFFDFENPGDVANWSPAKLAEAKGEAPAPKIEFSAEGAAKGKFCLKITFAGGQWPVIATSVIPVKTNCKEYQTLKAELIVVEGGIAFLGIGQGVQDAKGLQPQWQKTLFLHPGRNAVALTIRHGLGRTVIDPKLGPITTFVIGMFQPDAGQVLSVDNVRLSSEWPEPNITGWYSPYNHDGYSAWSGQDFERTRIVPPFSVAGTDRKVVSYEDLSKESKSTWKPPAEKTLEQMEAEFRMAFAELKKSNPGAVLAVLREGDKGFDPAHPDKLYAGWKFTYLSCHGPDGPNAGRETVAQKGDTVEAFMRHRGVLMQPDLSCIPKGSAILAARLVVARAPGKDLKGPVKANLWFAEPCNRAWDPDFANCYYYAKGKRWKAVSGLYYGQDPDFHPVLLTYGPGSAPVSAWDFTAGMKFWLDQGHENHGFFLYGDSGDYMRMYSPKAKTVEQRPALYVIYVPLRP